MSFSRVLVLAVFLITIKILPAFADEFSEAVSGKSDRGFPYEYDPGPPAGSRWAELFAATPNYRALGISVLGGTKEKFRWTFGPMFYRGRLAPDSVKVLVIGQEGAQDESLSNRSFTGGTGSKMQYFLKHLGITQSYLFMNTFVYTINGQYSEQEGPNKGKTPPALFWLAQNPSSPVVKHRHEILDYVFATNRQSLALVIAVGTAAKDTIKTYLASKGGKCLRIDDGCDADVLGKAVKIIGVRHPGGASPNNGGASALAGIQRDFSDAAQKIAQWNLETIFISRNRNEWLPADAPGRGMKVTNRKAVFTPEYEYLGTSIPFKDFAFGTTWRLGRGGTSSNRKDRQQSIQLFSEAGCYNAYCEKNANGIAIPTDRAEIANPYAVPLDYKATRPQDLISKILNLPNLDLPWEAPRTRFSEFDAGPGEDYAKLLMGYDPALSQPSKPSALAQFQKEYVALGGIQDSSFGFNGLYRGRFEKPQLLILADQESNDDLFSTRAFTGTGGQLFQRFLETTTVGNRYLILRTLPMDVTGLNESAQNRLVTEPSIQAARESVIQSVLKQGTVKAVLAIGPGAQLAISQLRMGMVSSSTGGNIPVISLAAPGAAQAHVASWNQALGTLSQIGLADQNAKYDGEISTIPRQDFPFQTKWWVGTSGTRSASPMNRDTGRIDGNYYKIYMPNWVFRLKPAELSNAEKIAIKQAPKPDTSTSGMGGSDE